MPKMEHRFFFSLSSLPVKKLLWFTEFFFCSDVTPATLCSHSMHTVSVGKLQTQKEKAVFCMGSHCLLQKYNTGF